MATSAAAERACSATMRAGVRSLLRVVPLSLPSLGSKSRPWPFRARARANLPAPTAQSRGRPLTQPRRWPPLLSSWQWCPRCCSTGLGAPEVETDSHINSVGGWVRNGVFAGCCALIGSEVEIGRELRGISHETGSLEHPPGQPGGQLSAAAGREERVHGESRHHSQAHQQWQSSRRGFIWSAACCSSAE